MEGFEFHPFASASSHPVFFHDLEQHPQIIEADSQEPGKTRLGGDIKQRWESLKPLIQRIYIEEDKPFPYLAKVLREEHGFDPT